MQTQLTYSGMDSRRKKSLSSSLGLLFLLLFAIPSFSQDGKVSAGSVDAFYESLKPGRARMASNKKTIKVKSNETVNVLIKNNSQVDTKEIFTGKVEGTNTSYVFFSYKDGSMDGKVIMPEKKKAYRYFSENGTLWVLPEDIEKVLCTEYQEVETAASAALTAGAPPAGSPAYNLQSLPGATAVVLLDFDGHDATGSFWGDIIAEPANVTEQEIEEAWRVVSEDFRPFQLNITTNEAVYQAAPVNRRSRCVITPTSDAAPGWGGVAFIGSFPTGGELAPCWVFNIGNGKLEGETASHEIGHVMGLTHDGRELPGTGHEEYFGGHGNWAPIMGVSFSPEATQWSMGEYQFANNTQDDIFTIARATNGFGFRPDPQGSTISTSGTLVYGSNGVLPDSVNMGVINHRDDVDLYAFATNGGNVNMVVIPTAIHPNLDIVAFLYNGEGVLMASSNPPGIAPAGFNLDVPAGTYYIGIDGIGYNDPLTDGYSDYSSVGEYTISGTIANAVVNQSPVVTITAPEDGTLFPGSGVTIVVNADASDADGSVSLVELYAGEELLASDNSAPYSFILENVLEGTYTFTAVATDNFGFHGTSDPVTVTVVVPIGMNGPDCVVSGQPYEFFVNPEFSNFHSISWWTTGDAIIQQNSQDSRRAVIYLSQWNQQVQVRAGISYTGFPYYAEYFKQVQVNNCSNSLKMAANHSEENSTSVSTVKIFQLNGREVLTGQTTDPDAYIKDRYLPSGLYLMQVITDKESYMKKIIK